MPVSGPGFRRYGGATTCYEVAVDERHRLLIDAGTGILSLGMELPTFDDLEFTVLITHLHWDHTLGLPFFEPLYRPTNRFTFYGHPTMGMTIEQAIDAVMRPPWFPVAFTSTPSRKSFVHLDEASFKVADIAVRPVRLNHPQGVTAYRLERDGKVVVMATDVEHGEPESDEALTALARGADLLIYDAQYRPDEYEEHHIGWGHSTWREAVDLASRAGVGRLVLTSHDPFRTDDEVDEILAEARMQFPATDSAYEGMVLEV
ncbi:MAG: MBL fold metallo-hydrolase [Acidimicrobiia bacterium]|nr:MAG: MBL fold metallo-hydrolase [Acidimicrobiia bacterium]